MMKMDPAWQRQMEFSSKFSKMRMSTIYDKSSYNLFNFKIFSLILVRIVILLIKNANMVGSNSISVA